LTPTVSSWISPVRTLTRRAFRKTRSAGVLPRAGSAKTARGKGGREAIRPPKYALLRPPAPVRRGAARKRRATRAIRSPRHERPRKGKEGRREDPAGPRGAQGPPEPPLRCRHPFRPRRPPGDRHGGKGRHDPPRLLGSEPAGLQGRQLQEADRAG